MLRMIIFGLLQTMFFTFIMKTYLGVSWPTTIITLLTIFTLLLIKVRRSFTSQRSFS